MMESGIHIFPKWPVLFSSGRSELHRCRTTHEIFILMVHSGLKAYIAVGLENDGNFEAYKSGCDSK